jgi:hypothetical protein
LSGREFAIHTNRQIIPRRTLAQGASAALGGPRLQRFKLRSHIPTLAERAIVGYGSSAGPFPFTSVRTPETIITRSMQTPREALAHLITSLQAMWKSHEAVLGSR